MIRVFSLAVFTVFLTITLQPAIADEAQTYHPERDFSRHNPSLFAGASTTEDQTGFTVGAGYEFTASGTGSMVSAWEGASSHPYRHQAALLKTTGISIGTKDISIDIRPRRTIIHGNVNLFCARVAS
jgi:hypothetical protein